MADLVLVCQFQPTNRCSAEVTQQTKARHKDDFLQAFSPFIADATAMAYKGASADIQAKLRRVVDVWRERNIFDAATQTAMEARLDGMCCTVVKEQ